MNTTTHPFSAHPFSTHRFSAWSFIFGALFLLVTAGWAAAEVDLVESTILLAAVPVSLIVLGLAGLALTFRPRTKA